MTKQSHPITVYCRDTEHAALLASDNTDSKALLTGVGTLKFHLAIAQHGAGEFKTLYVPVALKGKFMVPAGGTVIHLDQSTGE